MSSINDSFDVITSTAYLQEYDQSPAFTRPYITLLPGDETFIMIKNADACKKTTFTFLQLRSGDLKGFLVDDRYVTILQEKLPQLEQSTVAGPILQKLMTIKADADPVISSKCDLSTSIEYLKEYAKKEPFAIPYLTCLPGDQPYIFIKDAYNEQTQKLDWVSIGSDKQGILIYSKNLEIIQSALPSLVKSSQINPILQNLMLTEEEFILVSSIKTCLKDSLDKLCLTYDPSTKACQMQKKETIKGSFVFLECLPQGKGFFIDSHFQSEIQQHLATILTHKIMDPFIEKITMKKPTFSLVKSIQLSSF
ncbi:MAG: hypothetical protein WCG10_08150, partial [Chlamydiota bacterium]